MESYITCLAQGNSMYPAINNGDTLIVKENITNLNINDIVLYKDDNKKLFVHRIIDIFYCGGVKFFITKGDNCVYEDRPVEVFNVIGIVIDIIKAKSN